MDFTPGIYFAGRSIPLDLDARLIDPQMIESSSSQPKLYVPIASPPTPAPSPRPTTSFASDPFIPSGTSSRDITSYEPAALSRREFASLAVFPPSVRQRYLLSILGDCTPSELLFISTTIAPLLKRDFLREL